MMTGTASRPGNERVCMLRCLVLGYFGVGFRRMGCRVKGPVLEGCRICVSFVIWATGLESLGLPTAGFGGRAMPGLARRNSDLG